ncbi:DUF983 domain-containing protein [Tepidicaulis sp.]|uniref:DUF983 domain-containing protein n=1 Tax=Tepidicaulis sp. TaxID=1920809 RepID=UPI003B5BFD6B
MTESGNTLTYRNERRLWPAMWKGMRFTCPHCGEGKLFTSYLKITPRCASCGEELHHHRADDAPPYFTILIVGHVIVPMMMALEFAYWPPLWVHAAIWLPLTAIMSLALLPVAKGATVGLQWALRMEGFGRTG